MLRLLNVAIPALAPVPVRFDASPESVPPPGLFPMATVTVGRPPGNDVTLFPKASWTVTLTAGVMIVPAVVLLGCTVKASCAAGPAVTETVAVWLIATPSMVAEMLFVSAVVELKVPVAASTTVTPAIGFPNPSLAVAVMVDAVEPLLATIDVGAAVTVDALADTPAAVTETLAVCVSATPLTVAETVLGSALVELSEPVAT